MQSTVALALAALLAMTQDKAEEKENPGFKYWSNCKPGSWVKTKTERDHGGQKVETEITVKLLEISDERAILEESGKTKMGEREVVMPATKKEFKAKQPAGKFKVEREGDEEIEVGGKKLACRTVEMTMTLANDKTAKMKFWMSKEIPGGVARTDISPQEGQTIKSVAVEWEKK